MDGKTNHVLSFAGVQCRVIGTFYLDKENKLDAVPHLTFGSDISNYYPNQGLKVYKPNKESLETIVGYSDINDDSLNSVVIGTIRYASTNRGFQGISDIKFSIRPDDFCAQKTALFGMTRTGKSNTTKIILQSVFSLRFDNLNKDKIGQVVGSIPLWHRYKYSGVDRDEKLRRKEKMDSAKKRKLKYHLKEVAKILKKETPESELQDFESIELAARKYMVETVGPEIGEFFFQQAKKKARQANDER